VRLDKSLADLGEAVEEEIARRLKADGNRSSS
jgi:hypothetical protein